MENITEEVAEKEENSHIINLWTPCKFNINPNYKYVPKNKIFRFFSDFLYYGIAIPVLTVLLKILYDLKIEGRENIQNITSGAVSVSNHVLFLDCAMTGIAFRKQKIYYTTLEQSFKIPFVRRLIKLLRAIPIPKSIENKKYFVKAIDELLQKGNIIHFYPEAALRPYCNKIRHFKNGAFDFAVRNQVPIVPLVYTFRKPKGIRKVFKKKPDVTLIILKPIKYNSDITNIKEKVNKLKEDVFLKMNNVNENIKNGGNK